MELRDNFNKNCLQHFTALLIIAPCPLLLFLLPTCSFQLLFAFHDGFLVLQLSFPISSTPNMFHGGHSLLWTAFPSVWRSWPCFAAPSIQHCAMQQCVANESCQSCPWKPKNNKHSKLYLTCILQLKLFAWTTQYLPLLTCPQEPRSKFAHQNNAIDLASFQICAFFGPKGIPALESDVGLRIKSSKQNSLLSVCDYLAGLLLQNTFARTLQGLFWWYPASDDLSISSIHLQKHPFPAHCMHILTTCRKAPPTHQSTCPFSSQSF